MILPTRGGRMREFFAGGTARRLSEHWWIDNVCDATGEPRDWIERPNLPTSGYCSEAGCRSLLGRHSRRSFRTTRYQFIASMLPRCAVQKYVAPFGTGTFSVVPTSGLRDDQVTLRLDHKLTDTQQLSMYYYFNNDGDTEPFATFQGAGSNVPGFRSIFDHARCSRSMSAILGRSGRRL